mmetsp:Transcript_3177/g.4677  ORF Transcript_3177/g.4677 Transcript_3177/m.4677 type:complete len:629 (+) Transcript_3177:95-1981(+)
MFFGLSRLNSYIPHHCNRIARFLNSHRVQQAVISSLTYTSNQHISTPTHSPSIKPHQIYCKLFSIMAENKKEVETSTAPAASIEDPTSKSATSNEALAINTAKDKGDANSNLNVSISGEDNANVNANANANEKENGSKSNKRKKNAYFQKKAKKKVERQKNMRNTWKSRTDAEVHPGSYADPEMRKMFNVSIPELDSTDDNTDGAGTVKNIKQEKKDDDGVSGDPKDKDKEIAEDVEKKSQNGTVKKNPKRKVALLLGFKGTEYVGMQINKGQKTIQAQVELGLFQAGLISKSNFGHPNKYGWSNSARTDKGVHSCAQVCSVKIEIPTGNYNVVREMINDQLPDDITVADIIQVPRTFCARTARSKVRYQYMLPSFALLSRAEVASGFESVLGSNWKDRSLRTPFSQNELKLLREKFAQHRASEDNLEKLNSALGKYEGTNKYHNYTSGKASDDASAKRYIQSFTVQESVVDKHGVEWIPTLVVGQSFLLHQIRKMLSMAMDTARGASSLEIMDTSFSDKYININTAPANGLFLDMSYYGHFNNKANLSTESKLDWHSDEESPAHKRWKGFKENQVMSHIMDEEQAQGNFLTYLFSQDHHVRYENYVALDVKKGKEGNPSVEPPSIEN